MIINIIIKNILSLFLFFFIFFIVSSTEAVEVNNKFGIHLAQPTDKDIGLAVDLVNSKGGEWGYVTLVIHEDDKDIAKWQGIFDNLREKKLIPIIRIATKPDGANWEKAKIEDAPEWSQFLNSLRWVIKKRYIILFNEPNHATEWGGEVNSVEYAKVIKAFAKELKETNPDFFIMGGGLDLAAPSILPKYEDANIFFEAVVDEITPQDFNMLFDGLSSHSYPNPGFVGSPFDSGRKSIRGYDWELKKLKELGVKSLPVFITETGWNGDVVPRVEVARNYNYAFTNIWLPDKRVYAITPFILNYQSEPFLKFSWFKKGSDEPHPEFLAVKSLVKKSGIPVIEESGDIKLNIPKKITNNSTYHFTIELKNTGQAIWSRQNGYTIEVYNNNNLSYISSSINKVLPGKTEEIDLYVKTTAEGVYENTVVLKKNMKKDVLTKKWGIEVLPIPDLELMVKIFPSNTKNTTDFELQVFDYREHMVFNKKDLNMENGVIKVSQIDNIAYNTDYRLVLLKNGYLPRQTYFKFTEYENTAKFEGMLPFDIFVDGKFDFNDIRRGFEKFLYF